MTMQYGRKIGLNPASEDITIPHGFFADFSYTVARIANKDPTAWSESMRTIGTLCENIVPSDDYDQYVSIPIQDQHGTDGGYIHVYGWEVVPQ